MGCTPRGRVVLAKSDGCAARPASRASIVPRSSRNSVQDGTEIPQFLPSLAYNPCGRRPPMHCHPPLDNNSTTYIVPWTKAPPPGPPVASQPSVSLLRPTTCSLVDCRPTPPMYLRSVPPPPFQPPCQTVYVHAPNLQGNDDFNPSTSSPDVHT